MHPILKNVHSLILSADLEKWKEISLIIKANVGFASYKGRLKTNDGEDKGLNIRVLPRDFSDNFIKLFEDKSINKGNEWNELELVMTPEGIIKVEFNLDRERKDRVDGYNNINQ